MALLTSTLNGALPLTARGKVRDLYTIDDDRLLFVATDRISAFDAILASPIEGRGRLLTLLSVRWFEILKHRVPDLRTHFLTLELPNKIPSDLKPVFQDRSMQVRKLKTFPVEAIVRGYLTGSAWEEYKNHGTVHGIPIPNGLKESEKLPEPLFTPSTKAPPGEKDENIHPSKVPELIGSAEYATRIEELSLKLYKAAKAHAFDRGIIVADTKFEFGLDEETGEVILIDEVLTPDSSRFWDLEKYEIGRTQESFDKQFLRNWLTESGLKGKSGVEIPDDIAKVTWAKYREVYERLTDLKWKD